MCPRHAALPVRQNRSREERGGLSGDSGPDSMMQGPCAPAGTWYWELYRDTGLARSQVQSTQHYWVRPELLTATPSAFKSLFTKSAEQASSQANTLFTFHAALARECYHTHTWG